MLVLESGTCLADGQHREADWEELGGDALGGGPGGKQNALSAGVVGGGGSDASPELGRWESRQAVCRRLTRR